MSDFRGNNTFCTFDVKERMEGLEESIDHAFNDWWGSRCSDLGIEDDAESQEDYRDEFLDSSPELADYARETAEQTCNVDFNSWPCNCIDWEDAAEELQAGYSAIELNGDTYTITRSKQCERLS